MDGINRAKLRGILAEKGMRYVDLAKKTGFSTTTICGFFKGANPSYKLMRAMKFALELDADIADKIFFAVNLPDR